MGEVVFDKKVMQLITAQWAGQTRYMWGWGDFTK